MNRVATKIAASFYVPEDVLRSALTSGMINGPQGYSYWCAAVSGRREGMSGEAIAQELLEGYPATVFERHELTGKLTRHTLTRGKLVRGFVVWAVTEGRGNFEGDGVIDFVIDAPSSDMIVQYAVFGKQVYG